MSITTLLVQCAATFGTAFAIDGGTVISAHHVFTGPDCEFASASVDSVSSIPTADTWIGRASDAHAAVIVPHSCERLKYGETYTLVGSKVTTYAVAERHYVRARLDGVLVKSRAMFGEVFPGQSGGPVMDDDGNARAIISATDGGTLVTVVELADTPVCAAE